MPHISHPSKGLLNGPVLAPDSVLMSRRIPEGGDSHGIYKQPHDSSTLIGLVYRFLKNCHRTVLKLRQEIASEITSG